MVENEESGYVNFTALPGQVRGKAEPLRSKDMALQAFGDVKQGGWSTMEGMPPKYVPIWQSPPSSCAWTGRRWSYQAAGGRRECVSEEGSDELVLNITTGGRSEVKRRCAFHGHVHGGSGAFFAERRSPGQGVFAGRIHSVARQTTIALGRFQTLGRRPPKEDDPSN